MKSGIDYLIRLTFIVVTVGSCRAQVSYTATPLPSPSGLFNSSLSWISDDGTTGFGGGINSTNYYTECFTYQNGTYTIIPTPGFSCQPVAAAVGNCVMLLTAVGSNGTIQSLASYTNGTLKNLTPPTNVSLPVYETMGVNKSGQIVGTLSCPDGIGIIPWCAYEIASNGAFTALSNSAWSSAGAINDLGDVAGWIAPSGFAPFVNPFDVVVWSHTGQQIDLSSMSSLSQLGYPIAINSKDQVVGEGGSGLSSFFYDGSSTVTPIQVTGAYSIVPTSLNDQGEVVGRYSTAPGSFSRAFHWVNGQSVDLNTVVTNLPKDAFLIYANYINNAGQILVTAASSSQPVGVASSGTYLLTPTTGSVQDPPEIIAVANAAGGFLGTAPQTFITLQGENLSKTTRSWNSSDFVNGSLPTSLDGVFVTVNGRPAYVTYVSTVQLNILTPADTATGPVQVQVTNSFGTSAPFTVNQTAIMPEFFAVSNSGFVMATHANGTLVAPAGYVPGVTSSPAALGETIAIYGTGFGQLVGSPNLGQLLTSPVQLLDTVTVTVAGEPCTVTWAGISENGLDQINVTLPASLPTPSPTPVPPGMPVQPPSPWPPIAASVNGIAVWPTGLQVAIQN